MLPAAMICGNSRVWSISCLQIVMIEEEHGRLQAQETSEVATAFVIGAPRCRAKEPNAWKLATCYGCMSARSTGTRCVDKEPEKSASTLPPWFPSSPSVMVRTVWDEWSGLCLSCRASVLAERSDPLRKVQSQ